MHKFKTFAKINLFLHIIGKREDGYHLLESIFYFPEIYDEISFKEAEVTKLSITGRFAGKLDEKNNLVIKAFDILKKEFLKKLPNLNFILEKNLPVSAGIGGGSANAGGVLRELNKYYKLGISNSELYKIGEKLGADVPPCIAFQACFVSGIGEKIDRINNFPELNILLVNPLKPVVTSEIFRKGFANYSDPLKDKNFENLSLGELVSFLKEKKNDLYENALSLLPEISGVVKLIGKQKGCLLSRMSGSGATCFGIFDTKENLEDAFKDVGKITEYWVAKSY